MEKHSQRTTVCAKTQRRHLRGKAGFTEWWGVGHTYHQEEFFFFFGGGIREEKKITYLSSFLKTAGVGLGDSVRLPQGVELYQHLLDECINEEKILKSRMWKSHKKKKRLEGDKCKIRAGKRLTQVR